MLGGFNEIFLISRSADEFLPGRSEKNVYQATIAHLGFVPGVMVGALGAL